MSLGSFRYFLAILVLCSHLWIGMPHGFAAYAVWGFFLLSGFLMTHVLTLKYGVTLHGIGMYLYNRALRIYPLYWITMLLGFLGMRYLDTLHIDYKELNDGFGTPETALQWIKNLFLWPDYHFSNPVPVANALRIEVFYYFLMIPFAFDKRLAWLGFLVSLLWNGYYLFLTYIDHVDTFSIRYATLGPCMLSFTAGSLLFQYKKFFDCFASKYLSLLAWGMNGLIWYRLPNYPWSIGIYISLGFSAWVIISLYKEKPNKLDQLLGDLSYPIYLTHSIVGAILLIFLTGRSFEFMLVSFLLTNIMSLVLVKLLDEPLRKLKFNIKK